MSFFKKIKRKNIAIFSAVCASFLVFGGLGVGYFCYYISQTNEKNRLAEKFSLENSNSIVCVTAVFDTNYILGTGSFLDQEGRIVTNKHVVTKENELKVAGEPLYIRPKSIYIRFSNEKESFPVEISDHKNFFYSPDPLLDLAIIKVKPNHHYWKPIGLPDSKQANLRRNDWVFAMGNAEGKGTIVTTIGCFKEIVDTYDGVKDWLYSRVRTVHGNSGGPLLNTQNCMIGITTRSGAGDDWSNSLSIPIEKIWMYYLANTEE